MGPKKWWQYLFFIFLVGGLVLTALTALALTIVYPTLPSLEALTNYKPKLPLRIYSAEGDLIGEFGEERRAFVKIEDVPEHMKNAVLAIEDRRFYSHNGIDTKGIIRAIRNNVTGVSHEGASTITMQVAKNFFSKPDAKRDIVTKIKEALLAVKIENTISKDKILELYLNQIYLGQRSYGFAAAAQVYYGKSLKDLNLAEAALLAGLPKAPSRYNPYVHLDLATNRQHEVLRDMKRYGFIDDSEYQKAIKTTLKFKSSKTIKHLSADYVAEIVRVSMYNRFGEDIYQSGYKVYTTIKKANQEAANQAVIQGIVDYELRHGFRGPERVLDQSPENMNPSDLIDSLSDIEEFNGFIPAVVTKVDKKSIEVVSKRGKTISMSDKSIALIQKFISTTQTDPKSNAKADAKTDNKIDPKKQITVGAVIRIASLNGEWQVVQLPKVEASLIALNPQTGEVDALIGGFDFNRSKFNHVTQGWRQPGSSFKPFVYSAALEKGFTPATIVEDAPLSFSAEDTGSSDDWEPHNYDSKYAGPMRLRTALTKSKNTVSIRVLDAIGPRYAQSYITKFGFAAKDHPAYLAMALGAGSTTSWNLAAGYAVFANSGYLVKPYLITKIIDTNGKVLESANPAAHISSQRVIDVRNTFIMTSMMQDVINFGTATPAKRLGRSDIAGKTGTTNNQVDAWFAGYNPKQVAIAWMGYDTPKSLGRDETGGKAALPIWIKYMETVLKNTPVYMYKVPEGVSVLKINPANGTMANDFEDGINEYFYHENPPPEAQYDIPPLEDASEETTPESLISNPLQPAPVNISPPPVANPTSAAPVEERRLEPSATTDNRAKPVKQTKPEPPPTHKPNINPAARFLNAN